MTTALHYIHLMRYYDESLVQAARNYAFTGDKKWERRYRMIEPVSDKLLKNAVENVDKKDKEFFSAMDKANLALVEMETRSLELVNSGQASEAIKILDSNEYESQRKILRDGLAEYANAREFEYFKPDHPSLRSTDVMNDSVKDVIELEKRLVQSERNAQNERKKYRSLYENSTILLRTVDQNGIVLDCNRTYAEHLGYPKEELIGSSVFKTTAEQSFDVMRNSLETWKKTGFVTNQEIWFKKKDGTIFPGLLSANDLINENGERIGSNTVIKDISDMHIVRKELEEQKIKRLYTIGELSARIAHDLRNPLSIIKNSIGLIKIKNPDMDEHSKEDLQRMDRAIGRMTHQIEEVLNYVTPKPLNMIQTNISSILHSTMDRITLPKDVTIVLPKNEIEIVCDQEKMEIVFVNLITNAIQAMNNKGQITIRTFYDDKSIVIEVEDTGPGIPDDILPQIFDPLFTTRQIGTGLGLPSCKNIVEQHGGTIWAKSEAGKSTTIYISLPTKMNVYQ